MMLTNTNKMVFPNTLDLQDGNLYWWVVHTKPNQERKLSDQLKQENVPHFLPLVEKRKRNRKRESVMMDAPLFPSYLFFAGQQNERLSVLRTGRTVNLITVLDQDRLRNELQQVYQALQSGLTIDPYKDIKKGSKCRVISGPGQGLEGRVIRLTKKYKLIIEVQTIGQSIMVEVSADDLAFEQPSTSSNSKTR